MVRAEVILAHLESEWSYQEGEKIAEYNEFIGNSTNNLAEYMALKKALKMASTLKTTR